MEHFKNISDMANDNLEISQCNSGLKESLVEFFNWAERANEKSFFWPHPFTEQEAIRICDARQCDYYCLVRLKNLPIGYGLLRGWEEGYEIPSLGLAIRTEYRGKGIGLMLMYYLHSVAKLRQCKKVRLRVNKTNAHAIRLYEKIGYQFQDDTSNYLLGFIDL